MNFYLYNITIFDTAVDADLAHFPKIEPWTAIAENEDEVQRKIIEDLFTPRLGTCAAFSRPDDSADRFHIVFGDPDEVAEVIWDDETNEWVWAEPH